MRKVLLLDTGVANMASLSCALKAIGVESEITSQADNMHLNFSHIILPGVGSFDRGCERLKESGLDDIVFKSIAVGKPILGICLGMQLLCCDSEESVKKSKGLGIFDKSIKKLEKPLDGYWPKIGWSPVDISTSSPLTKNIPNGEDFYFIHGFYADVGVSTVATSSFAMNYSAIIRSGNTYGVQFHPEKSQKNGLLLLENFCSLSS